MAETMTDDEIDELAAKLKAARKERRKAKAREYSRRPEVKAKMRERYRSRPDVIERDRKCAAAILAEARERAARDGISVEAALAAM